MKDRQMKIKEKQIGFLENCCDPPNPTPPKVGGRPETQAMKSKKSMSKVSHCFTGALKGG